MKMMAAEFTRVRPMVAAGRFYPGRPEPLRRMIHDFLKRCKPVARPAPKAIIVPHAGYPFSGPVAASAYARLATGRGDIDRVVLLGPSHYVQIEGLAASDAEAFATPLGPVPVDADAVHRICSLPQVAIDGTAHAEEHSLEVQLPFLQAVLGDFKIVPLVVGDATDEQVAEVIELLWDGPATRLVVSSDLSHYFEYSDARRLDEATRCAIEELRIEDISELQACGRTPICGLLRVARRAGLRPYAVDLRNSGDIAGPRDQVVGYGAFVIEAPRQPE